MDLDDKFLGWVEAFKRMRPPRKRKEESVQRMKRVKEKKDCSFHNVKRRSGEGLI